MLVAWLAAIALALPSLAPLPWFATALAARHDAAQGHARDGDAHAHRHADAAAPGSPLHPEDHDCAVCKVLKHLSRCIPSAPMIVATAPHGACAVPPAVAIVYLGDDATLHPPARAPPSLA